jgi:hypothetical protein
VDGWERVSVAAFWFSAFLDGVPDLTVVFFGMVRSFRCGVVLTTVPAHTAFHGG